jgi:hypothetical protein
MWCCKACGHQMHVVRTVPDVTAMAPGYEYRLYECPGGHAKRWRLVFNGPLMADNIGLPRTPSRLRVWAAKTAVAAAERWGRSTAMLTGSLALFGTAFFQKLIWTRDQVRDRLFRDQTLILLRHKIILQRHKIVSFLANAFDRRPEVRATGASRPRASLEGRTLIFGPRPPISGLTEIGSGMRKGARLDLLGVLRRATQDNGERQSRQLREAARLTPDAKYDSAPSTVKRSPQLPASRNRRATKRLTAAQVSEATFLLRRLARVHRRELSPAVRS